MSVARPNPCDRLLAAALAITLAGCAGEDLGPSFVATARYEEVARAGTATEDNPLFVYHRMWPGPGLVEGPLAFYGEGSAAGARLVVASPVTGDGWELSSRAGAEGPGEFGGQVPLIFTTGDTVKALTVDGRFTAWLSTGEFLYDTAFRTPVLYDPDRNRNLRPVGIVAGERLVLHYRGRPDLSRHGRQVAEQGITITSPAGRIRDVELDSTIVVIDQNTSTNDAPALDARNGVIAYAYPDSREIVLLDSEGAVLARATLPWRIFSITIDADGRVWASTWSKDTDRGRGQRYLVLDRELNVVDRVQHWGFRDASGDYVLSVERDSLDALAVVVSRRAG